jgi:O-antigen/teichoic acid export membrane protein
MGLETSYFRYSNQMDERKLYRVLSTFLLASSLTLIGVLYFFDFYFIPLMEMDRNPNFYYLILAIVFVDTLCALPFVRLRQEGKSKRFAIIKFINILCNVFFVVLYLIVIPRLLAKGIHLPSWLYQEQFGIGYYIVANLLASLLAWVLLFPEWRSFRIEWDGKLLKQVMAYSFPILIVGFGGMINDFLSRIVYYKVLDNPVEQLDHEFGVFAANYKLAVLATIFIQVFKMGAEPFFFKHAQENNAQETYARVMKIFVIICCLIFLSIAMNLDILILLISSGHAAYAEGKDIIPVLTLANIFLGIYYNLAIWYKLKDQTMKGALITFVGVFITVLLNVLLIPKFHYVGASWATFICYAFMMVVSYFWGQKHYFIPYDVKRCLAYLGLSVGLFAISSFIQHQLNIHHWFYTISTYVLSLGIFLFAVVKMDHEELKSLPFVGRYLR